MTSNSQQPISVRKMPAESKYNSTLNKIAHPTSTAPSGGANESLQYPDLIGAPYRDDRTQIGSRGKIWRRGQKVRLHARTVTALPCYKLNTRDLTVTMFNTTPPTRCSSSQSPLILLCKHPLTINRSRPPQGLRAV